MKQLTILASVASALTLTSYTSARPSPDECDWGDFTIADALTKSGAHCTVGGEHCDLNSGSCTLCNIADSSSCDAGESCVRDESTDFRGRRFCTNEDDPFIVRATDDFVMKDKHWDDFGGSFLSGSDTPLCALFEALSVLERGQVFGEDETILGGGYDYVESRSRKYKPRCTVDDRTTIDYSKSECRQGPFYHPDGFEGYEEECRIPDPDPYAKSGSSGGFQSELVFATGLPFLWGLSDSTKLYQDMFTQPAGVRASLLLHEAAHRRGRTHYLFGSTDLKYKSSYTNNQPTVWSQQVDWLMEYILLNEDREDIQNSPRAVIDNQQRMDAAEYTNEILDEKFNQDPGFRVAVVDVNSLQAASASGTSIVRQATVYKNSDYKKASTRTEQTVAFTREACGLTRIAGDFQNGHHDVRLRSVESAYVEGVNLWGLEVDNDTSPSNDKTIGHAQCFPRKELLPIGEDGELTVTVSLDGDSFKDAVLAPEAGNLCFLMQFKGKTEGTHERARAIVKDGEWVAEVRANNSGSQDTLKAKFGCIQADIVDSVSVSTDDSEYSIPFTDIEPSWTEPADPESVVQAYPFSCVLTEIHGRLRNKNDVNAKISASGDRWVLYVDQNKALPERRIGGTMKCFTY